MPQKVHDFQESLEKSHEDWLDEYFQHDYEVHPVSKDLQRLGIDRIFKRRIDGCEYTVEYKADSVASQTNNVFIETVSVDNQNKIGWALYSRAQLLIYFVPPLLIAYLIEMVCLKRNLRIWLKTYGTKKAQNKGYDTIGIPVPRDVFEEECCVEVISMVDSVSLPRDDLI